MILSSAAYPNKGTVLRREELCPILTKILTICAEKVVVIDGVSDNSLMLKKEEVEFSMDYIILTIRVKIALFLSAKDRKIIRGIKKFFLNIYNILSVIVMNLLLF